MTTVLPVRPVNSLQTLSGALSPPQTHEAGIFLCTLQLRKLRPTEEKRQNPFQLHLPGENLSLEKDPGTRGTELWSAAYVSSLP